MKCRKKNNKIFFEFDKKEVKFYFNQEYDFFLVLTIFKPTTLTFLKDSTTRKLLKKNTDLSDDDLDKEFNIFTTNETLFLTSK